MLTHGYTYAYAALDVQTGRLDTLILPQVNTFCMQIFLDEVAARHPNEHIVMDSLDAREDHLEVALKDFEWDTQRI